MNIVGLGLPGHSEIILIVFIVLLLFGAKKLPELARSLGTSLSEFKRGQKEDAAQEESSENSSEESTS
jgi:sec-independent protein translocase protein TatA